MGVYLRLFNGRRLLPDGVIEELDNWGAEGPVFGPFEFVHTTYAADVNFQSKTAGAGALYIIDDSVYYDGLYYGDWTVMASAKGCFKSDFKSAKAIRGQYVLHLRNQQKDRDLFLRATYENDNGPVIPDFSGTHPDDKEVIRYDTVECAREAFSQHTCFEPGDVVSIDRIIKAKLFSDGKPMRGELSCVERLL